jgi:hypothetical protein
MLLVVSKQGLWEAHIWEQPSMGRFVRNGNGDVVGLQNPLAQDFQYDVINLINTSDGPGKNIF